MEPLDLELPHPDNIEFDEDNADVIIHGPETKEDFKRTLVRVGARAELEAILISHEYHGFVDPETIEMYRSLIHSFKTDHPSEIVYWDLFGEARMSEYLDWLFYYGPQPTRWTIEYFESKANKFLGPKDIGCSDGFRPFMRKKLKELMGDAWYDRLEPANLVVRDECHDRMRYRYEVGIFDPDDYELSDEERPSFSEKAFLDEYMKWD